jgi:predicted nuclease with RNAse H fold
MSSGLNVAVETTTTIAPLRDGRVEIAMATSDRTRILRLLADGSSRSGVH